MSIETALSGRVAVVTGAESGIGRAVAVALARAGCQVIATTLADGETAADPSLPWRNLRLDVTKQADVDRLIDGLDRLDILVNCAGVLVRGGAEFEMDTFEHVLDVNLAGTMRMCLACRPLLAHGGGAIVNMASMLSIFGSGYVPGYSASKGGVVQLTRSLAIAWAAEGIRVNAIAPGWIATGMTRALRDDPARERGIVERTPLARWGTPDDVAGPVLFLCSPAAAFVTGAVLPVDGGYSVM